MLQHEERDIEEVTVSVGTPSPSYATITRRPPRGRPLPPTHNGRPNREDDGAERHGNGSFAPILLPPSCFRQYALTAITLSFKAILISSTTPILLFLSGIILNPNPTHHDRNHIIPPTMHKYFVTISILLLLSPFTNISTPSPLSASKRFIRLP